MRRILIPILVLAAFILPINASSRQAEGGGYTADEFGVDGILDSLPEGAAELLPNADIYSPDDFSENFGAGYFLELLKDAVTVAISPALETFAVTLGLLTVASLMSLLKGMFKAEAISTVIDLAVSVAIMLALYGTVSGLAETVREFLTRLAALMGASLPVMTAISVTGGNVTAATVSANGMMLGLSIVEILASEMLYPIIQLCFGLAVASGMGGKLIKLNGISGLVRGVLTFMFALVGAVISAVMTFQNSIAAHADSLSLRAVRFAASQAIPVVGGMAGDAVGTVATGLSLVKSTVGWVGVILLLIVTVPVLAELLLTRLGISASVTVADMLGLDRERALLAEIRGLLGFMTAVSVIASVMFVYGVALFAGTASALA